VIPDMIRGGARVYGYRFDGYWQDVGTIQSYWEANMALLEGPAGAGPLRSRVAHHNASEERRPPRSGRLPRSTGA